MIRNGSIKEAHEVMKRWSKNEQDEVSSFEMENTWYSLLTAKAHLE